MRSKLVLPVVRQLDDTNAIHLRHALTQTQEADSVVNAIKGSTGMDTVV